MKKKERAKKWRNKTKTRFERVRETIRDRCVHVFPRLQAREVISGSRIDGRTGSAHTTTNYRCVARFDRQPIDDANLDEKKRPRDSRREAKDDEEESGATTRHWDARAMCG